MKKCLLSKIEIHLNDQIRFKSYIQFFLYDSGLLHRLYGSISIKITPRVYKISLANLKYHSLLTLELTLYNIYYIQLS